MVEIKKILYPTDFSEQAACALPYARDLARRFGSELHCLHVLDEAYQYWAGAGESAVPTVVSEEELLSSARRQMDEFVAKHFGPEREGLVCELVLGRPFLEIIHYAQENEIDLIVIATHGRGALASMLLGSVTEKVVRKAPCPVLTVRYPGHKFVMP